jgi:hypothetical protein
LSTSFFVEGREKEMAGEGKHMLKLGSKEGAGKRF